MLIFQEFIPKRPEPEVDSLRPEVDNNAQTKSHSAGSIPFNKAMYQPQGDEVESGSLKRS